MARTHLNFNSSLEKEHHELVAELKALKDVIKDLSDKIDRISISTDAGRKETQVSEEIKEKGHFRVGDEVKLKTKAKYGKRGDIAKVEHIGKAFITVRLQSGKTTTRKPENLCHHEA